MPLMAFWTRLLRLAAKNKLDIDPHFEVFERMQIDFPKKNSENGHLSTNLAMLLAKPLDKDPIEVAQLICDELMENLRTNQLVQKAEPKSPGFINIWVHNWYWERVMEEILSEGPITEHQREIS